MGIGYVGVVLLPLPRTDHTGIGYVGVVLLPKTGHMGIGYVGIVLLPLLRTGHTRIGCAGVVLLPSGLATQEYAVVGWFCSLSLERATQR